jgi:hypothetical protein
MMSLSSSSLLLGMRQISCPSPTRTGQSTTTSWTLSPPSASPSSTSTTRPSFKPSSST